MKAALQDPGLGGKEDCCWCHQRIPDGVTETEWLFIDGNARPGNQWKFFCSKLHRDRFMVEICGQLAQDFIDRELA